MAVQDPETECVIFTIYPTRAASQDALKGIEKTIATWQWHGKHGQGRVLVLEIDVLGSTSQMIVFNDFHSTTCSTFLTYIYI